MMRLNRLLLPLLLLPAACVIPIGGAEVGDLRVTWNFDDGDGKIAQRCAQVGVDNVTIQLIEQGKEGKEGARAFGQTAECIAGSMVLLDVVAGTYIMTTVGEGEVALFTNDAGQEVVVEPNTLSDATSPLKLVNGEVVARVEFQYNFGGEAVCSAADVDAINAQVIDENGVAIAGSTTDCIAGLAVIEGIRVGVHTIKVEAADGDGNVRYVFEDELKGLQKGETLRLDPITMTPARADFTVFFNLDGQSCSEAGVDNVDVQLSQAGAVVAAQNVQCIDGRAVFEDMPVGTYQATLDAVDGNGEILFTTEDEAELVVDGVGGDDITVELDPLRSTVVVRFVLPNNLSCATANVDNLDIQIVDAEGNATGTNVNCIDGDSGELIVAAGNGATISVDAISGEDVTFSGTDTVNLDAGDQFVTIDLEAVRSTLVVSWDFETVVDANVQDPTAPLVDDTRSCTEADVDTVIVRVIRAGVLELAQAVDCDDGRMEIPGVAIGTVEIQIDGIREQEGDTPFKIEDDVVIAGNETRANFRLEPSLAFVLVIWAGNCGVAQAATVDLQVVANGVNSGINLPCAQGAQKLALPPNSEDGLITIRLRGIDGQGVPRGAAAEEIAHVPVVPGVNTFRFSGPSGT